MAATSRRTAAEHRFTRSGRRARSRRRGPERPLLRRAARASTGAARGSDPGAPRARCPLAVASATGPRSGSRSSSPATCGLPSVMRTTCRFDLPAAPPYGCSASRVLFNGRTPAFQAGSAGSTPAARSTSGALAAQTTSAAAPNLSNCERRAVLGAWTRPTSFARVVRRSGESGASPTILLNDEQPAQRRKTVGSNSVSGMMRMRGSATVNAFTSVSRSWMRTSRPL